MYLYIAKHIFSVEIKSKNDLSVSVFVFLVIW